MLKSLSSKWRSGSLSPTAESRLRGGQVQFLSPLAQNVDSQIAAEFWRSFAENAGEHLLAENFDHQAAHLWLGATDPPVLADQSSIIQRLLERRRATISTPLVTSYEEQDPHFGHWLLDVLAYEDYGEFKLVNNSYVHLNRPPVTLPPREHSIHICWGLGWHGATQAAPGKTAVENEFQERAWNKAPPGSVLQVVTLLLIDDWRHALRRLPVTFDLHRMNPLASSVSLRKGGKRWRLGEPKLPPGPVVEALFRRANSALTLGAWGLPVDRSSKSWWCALLFEADLPRLGFKQSAASIVSDHRHSWNAAHSRLPKMIDHVLAVPPQPGAGKFFRVKQYQNRVSLEPLNRSRDYVPVIDYWQFRVAALDLALDELWSRMH